VKQRNLVIRSVFARQSRIAKLVYDLKKKNLSEYARERVQAQIDALKQQLRA
jgi:hypothetical protein